jgi:hypothetical protein
VTGQLVDAPTVDAFADAMDRVQHTTFEAGPLVRHAAQFSIEQFEHGLRRTLTHAFAGTSPC